MIRKKQGATVCRSPLTSIHRSTTAIRRSTLLLPRIDLPHPTIHGSRRSIRPSTGAIASIDTIDPSIDQCHRVDRHRRSVHRPVPSRRSTPSIRPSTSAIASIDTVDQTIDTSHSNDRRRHGTRRPESGLRWRKPPLSSRRRQPPPAVEAAPRLSRSGGIAAAVRSESLGPRGEGCAPHPVRVRDRGATCRHCS